MANFSRNKKNQFSKLERQFSVTNYWLCVYSENKELEIGDFLYLNLSRNLNCKSEIETHKSTLRKSIENYLDL